MIATSKCVAVCPSEVREANAHVGGSLWQFEKPSIPPKILWCSISKENTAGLYLSNDLWWHFIPKEFKEKKHLRDCWWVLKACSGCDILGPAYGYWPPQLCSVFFWISETELSLFALLGWQLLLLFLFISSLLLSALHAGTNIFTCNGSRKDNKVWTLTSPAMNCPNPGGKVKVAMTSVITAGKTSRLGAKTGKSYINEANYNIMSINQNSKQNTHSTTNKDKNILLHTVNTVKSISYD